MKNIRINDRPQGRRDMNKQTQGITTVASSAAEGAINPQALVTRLLIGLSLLLVTVLSMATELLTVDHNLNDDGSVTINLQTNGDMPEPKSFMTDNPNRLVVDMADVIADGFDSVFVGQGGVKEYSLMTAGERTRLVVDLTQSSSYEVDVSGDTLSINLISLADFATGAASAGTNQITNLDFRRGDAGQAKVIITMSQPDASVAVNEQGDKINVELFSVGVSSDNQQRLDVSDFATPVRFVEARETGDGSRVVLTVAGAYDHTMYQSGNQLVIEVRKPAKVEKVTANDIQFFEDKSYDGVKVTFNFQDIEVRSLLQMIADVSDLNIVVADNVSGSMTLRLKNVPWDQALDMILDAKNLDMRKNGEIIWIAPAAEIAERERLLLQAAEDRRVLEPLRTELVQLSYAKATDIQELIMASVESAGDTETGLLSGRGSVTVDERTNTLLVNDTNVKIDEIKRLIEILDRAVRQVQIESRIVIARSDFNREIGVRWGVTGFSFGSNNLAFSGTGAGADSLLASGIDPEDGSSIIELPALGNRYGVNLPVANPAGSFGLSFLSSDILLDLELTALEEDGQGEVISSPRIITANQSEAFIKQGVEIPYQQAASSGATAVEFKEAVLELRVTPLITPDNRVQLDIEVRQDTVGENFVLAGGSVIPAIDTRELNTSVLVNNGETVVLGGIYQHETNEAESKVPFLGDIPYLGVAFRKRSTETQKRELLIFITPNILADRPPQ
ncbi:MAG: type IV pilus secretin PilQ [Xanthomonadales bacterium]|nr:type IV pilus secretin PilQ [Xanthomonadales bacterium]